MGNLGGSSEAYAINRSGQVVGYSYFADVNSLPHAFLVENGAMRDLGTLSGGKSSRAYDINDAGVVVGSADVDSSTGSHPMIYENNRMREIPSITGGSTPGIAHAINNRGQVVGESSNGTATRPFLYENGATRDLGTLGADEGVATDINEAGVVVGYSSIPYTTYRSIHHAFVYQDSALVDLNSYNPYPNGSSDAVAINENGQILLRMEDADGNQITFLILTPSGRKR